MAVNTQSQFAKWNWESLPVLVGIAALMIGGCSPSYSLQELKETLDDIRSTDGIITKSAMLSKIGKPQKVQAMGSDIYLYYPVKEGTVQIIVDGPAWEGKRAASVFLKGAVRPVEPDDLVKWYLDQRGSNPFSTKEELVRDEHVTVAQTGTELKVLVLQDGKETIAYTGGASFIVDPYRGYGSRAPELYESCVVTEHPKGEIRQGDKNMDSSGGEKPWPEKMAGYFAIRDKSGDMVAHVKYWDSIIESEQREAAKKQAEAIASKYMADYREYHDRLEKRLSEARENARNFIRSRLKGLAGNAWTQSSIEWDKKNSRAVDEPWVLIKAINQF